MKEIQSKSVPKLHLGLDQEPMARSTPMSIQNIKTTGLDDKDAEQGTTPKPEYQTLRRYAKTLRLTSDQLVCALDPTCLEYCWPI
jgi:hypothetical protein